MENSEYRDYLSILWKNKQLTIADVKAMMDYYKNLLEETIAREIQDESVLQTPDYVIDSIRFADDIENYKHELKEKISACNNWLHEKLEILFE